MTWILDDSYLLAEVGTIILRETQSGERHTLPPQFRRPGEPDQQFDARMQTLVAETLAGLDVYLTRRVNTRGRWQPRGADPK